MSTIFVATPDGRQRELSVVDFESQWLTQSLGAEAHYWTAGMEGWKPVIEYQPAAQSVTAAESAPSGLRLAASPLAAAEKISGLEPAPRQAVIPMTFTKDPGRLTMILKAAIWTHLFAHLVFSVAMYFLVQLDPKSQDVGAALIGLVAALGLFGALFVFLVTAIIFAMWVYRAKLNCEGFGAVGLRFTPGWSVGWFFVPFMNLVKPYQCMQETWRVSTSPKTWQGVKDGNIVGVWWALWICNNLLGSALGRFDEVKGVEQLTTFTILLGIYIIVGIAVDLVTLRMISEIYRRQKALVDSKEPMDISPLGTTAGVPLGLYR